MKRGPKSQVSEEMLSKFITEMVTTGKQYREVASENGIKPATLYASFKAAGKEIPNLKTRKKKTLPPIEV